MRWLEASLLVMANSYTHVEYQLADNIARYCIVLQELLDLFGRPLYVPEVGR